MEYTSFQVEPISEATKQIRSIFLGISKKARLAGNTSLLMELDRIPDLLLGPSNRVPVGKLDAANVVALKQLELIASSIADGPAV